MAISSHNAIMSETTKSEFIEPQPLTQPVSTKQEATCQTLTRPQVKIGVTSTPRTSVSSSSGSPDSRIVSHHNYASSRTAGIHISERRNCVGASKSLDTLRRVLQSSINEEIDTVIQKYLEKYIKPAVVNIELNQKAGRAPSNGTVTQQYVRAVCKQILDEAKKMY